MKLTFCTKGKREDTGLLFPKTEKQKSWNLCKCKIENPPLQNRLMSVMFGSNRALDSPFLVNRSTIMAGDRKVDSMEKFLGI